MSRKVHSFATALAASIAVNHSSPVAADSTAYEGAPGVACDYLSPSDVDCP
jgi:hypothetical protein